MKILSQEKIQIIIDGIVNSDMPSNIAQNIAKFLTAEFNKLPDVTEVSKPAKKIKE